MPQLSSELLVYAAIVAAFLLFNYVMQHLARKAREAREATVQHMPVEEAGKPLDDYSWGGGAPAPPEEVVRARTMQPTQPVAVPTVKPRRSGDAARLTQRLRGEEGLREAVVLMTILGPCRALEPYDPNARNRP